MMGPSVVVVSRAPIVWWVTSRVLKEIGVKGTRKNDEGGQWRRTPRKEAVGTGAKREMGRNIESLTCVGGWIVRGWHAWMRLYKEQSVNWYKWAVISRSFGIPREYRAERRLAAAVVGYLLGMSVAGLMGRVFSHVQSRLRYVTDQSQWPWSDFRMFRRCSSSTILLSNPASST